MRPGRSPTSAPRWVRPAASTEAGPAAVPFAAALGFWTRLGFISFGGPAGQIAIMHEELVQKRGWVDEALFLHALNFCMLLPGPEAQQLATYLGWRMHGVRGGIAAGALFVLPSLFVIAALAWLYVALGDTWLLGGALSGVKPVVVAIVALAAWRLGRRTLRNPGLAALAAAGCVARFAGLPFPLVIGFAALAGAAMPSVLRGLPVAAPASSAGTRASFDWRRALAVPACYLALSGTVYTGLVWAFGWEHPYATMARFFTQAAFLTFGGAYAVLPYVFDAAVFRYAWLDAEQMMDGLALGETTPGPLIMVVAFVGFVGGWQQDALAGSPPALAGALGAVVATWFTFLPSFLFIFAGAPVVESLRGVTAFSAPLAAVSATVVGVIAHLALLLAGHVFEVARPDWISVGVALAAWLALSRFRRGVVEVVGTAALIGLLRAFLSP